MTEQNNKEVRKILVLRGIQGSGKTTFAKQWVNEDSEQRVRFNRDDIRNMLGQYWVPNRESLINDMYDVFLQNAMEEGYDIVIDNMNLNEKYLEDIQDDIDWFNNHYYYNDSIKINWKYELEIKDFFHVPLQTCIDRDSKRDCPIGERVIRNTYNKYKDKIPAWKHLI